MEFYSAASRSLAQIFWGTLRSLPSPFLSRCTSSNCCFLKTSCLSSSCRPSSCCPFQRWLLCLSSSLIYCFRHLSCYPSSYQVIETEMLFLYRCFWVFPFLCTFCLCPSFCLSSYLFSFCLCSFHLLPFASWFLVLACELPLRWHQAFLELRSDEESAKRWVVTKT